MKTLQVINADMYVWCSYIYNLLLLIINSLKFFSFFFSLISIPFSNDDDDFFFIVDTSYRWRVWPCGWAGYSHWLPLSIRVWGRPHSGMSKSTVNILTSGYCLEKHMLVSWRRYLQIEWYMFKIIFTTIFDMFTWIECDFTGGQKHLHQRSHHGDIPLYTNDLRESRQTQHPHLPLRILLRTGPKPVSSNLYIKNTI